MCAPEKSGRSEPLTKQRSHKHALAFRLSWLPLWLARVFKAFSDKRGFLKLFQAPPGWSRERCCAREDLRAFRSRANIGKEPLKTQGSHRHALAILLPLWLARFLGALPSAAWLKQGMVLSLVLRRAPRPLFMFSLKDGKKIEKKFVKNVCTVVRSLWSDRGHVDTHWLLGWLHHCCDWRGF